MGQTTKNGDVLAMSLPRLESLLTLLSDQMLTLVGCHVLIGANMYNF
jgi:hypothetical protein